MYLLQYRIVFLACLLTFPVSAFAHGDESHDASPVVAIEAPTSQDSAPQADMASGPGSQLKETTGAGGGKATLEAPAERGASRNVWSISSLVNELSLSDFPTLHPMVVHVPVMLIPIALLFSVCSLFAAHMALVWLTLGFAVSGLAGGLVAAFPAHPHTTGLSDAAAATLQKHDFFAYGTLWLTSIALLLALACLWKPVQLMKLCLVAVLLFSALSVAITGHYGGTLAYVHGIGVQGQFLSTH